MVNKVLTNQVENHTIPSQSEGEGDQPSDIFSNKERAEWAWLKHDEELDFE